MTCIIGGKCSNGIVLVADRTVIYDNGNVMSKEKIFCDYYPFVVASSGSTMLFDKFRREAKESAQRSIGMYNEQQEFQHCHPIIQIFLE
jgi:20S proteasome alpha/beta subunit